MSKRSHPPFLEFLKGRMLFVGEQSVLSQMEGMAVLLNRRRAIASVSICIEGDCHAQAGGIFSAAIRL